MSKVNKHNEKRYRRTITLTEKQLKEIEKLKEVFNLKTGNKIIYHLIKLAKQKFF
jgi:hypothetical protein